jgi:hypothetical protein
MSTVNRVSPAEVRRKLEAGQALLVCAYESDTKFQRVALEGAIPFSEFQKRKPSLPSDFEIIFY